MSSAAITSSTVQAGSRGIRAAKKTVFEAQSSSSNSDDDDNDGDEGDSDDEEAMEAPVQNRMHADVGANEAWHEQVQATVGELFPRYDLDLSGTINSMEEASFSMQPLDTKYPLMLGLVAGGDAGI